MAYELTISDTFSPDEEKAVEDPLITYNLTTFGQSGKRDLAILLRDENGEVEGGLVGNTWRGWLYVKLLFIPEHARGQGLAGRLLDLAEEEAKRRGCIGGYLDTMNPQALKTYIGHGYTPIGSHGPLSGGHRITWLSKRFAQT